MTHEEMVALYAARAAAHVYNLGFVHAGTLYGVELTFAELAAYFKADRASSNRGGYLKVRIRLHKADKLALLARATVLGTDADLRADAAHNAGENYERIVTEAAGQRWVKDSVPFWVAGDLRVDGREVQVKLDGAELTNERTLSRLLAGLA